MRALATALASVAMAIGALGLAVASPHVGGRVAPRAALAAASGAVQIANSREGQAVLTAGAMRPGQGVSGTVRIGNAGDAAGRFSVKRSGVLDTPGAYGGRLSERMELVVFDVSDAQHPVTVYAGTPAGFDEVALGTIPPGAHRDYLFAATLPDGGLPGAAFAGDNRYQGSALSLGLEWRAGPASEASGPAPGPQPTPVPAPIAVPRPPATPSAPRPSGGAELAGELLADALGLPPARTCVRRHRLPVRLKAPTGARVRSAIIVVNGKVKARVKGARARRPVQLRRLPKGLITVAVTVRASNARSYTSTRTYRNCTAKPRAHKLRKRSGQS